MLAYVKKQQHSL